MSYISEELDENSLYLYPIERKYDDYFFKSCDLGYNDLKTYLKRQRSQNCISMWKLTVMNG